MVYYDQPSFVLENERVKCCVCETGAMLTAEFRWDRTAHTPFFIAPWHGEDVDMPPLRRALRGSFFCLPMGGDAEGYSGEQIPSHGYCANEAWICVHSTADRMELLFDRKGFQVRNEIQLSDKAPVIYERDIVTGLEGRYPVGFHPTVKLPEKRGQAHLGIGSVKEVFTTPSFSEKPENGGYCLYRSGRRYPDFHRMETIYGDFDDLAVQPIREGFEDIVLVAEENRGLGYAAVTFREEGYVYFQLKNLQKLPNTTLWISNGGRHYPPWNGRCKHVLGLEECRAYFTYGMRASVQPNEISRAGYSTCQEFKKGDVRSYEIIYGAAAVPQGFCGVGDICAVAGGIQLNGLKGEELFVPIDLDYLKL